MGLEYQLCSTDNNTIKFKKVDSTLGLAIVFCIVGFIPLILGGISNFNAIHNGVEMSIIALLFMGVGLVLVSMGSHFLMSDSLNPETFVFDNEKGVVKINQKRKTRLVSAEILYQDIEGFDYRAETTGSSGSNSSGYTNYVVYWLKKDGSVWDLCTFTSIDNALDFIQRLQQCIDLSKEGNPLPIPDLPRAVSLQKEGNTVLLNWQNKFNLTTLAFLFAFAGFAICTFGIFKQSKTSTSEYGFLSLDKFVIFFSVGLFLIVSVFLYNIIKNTLLTYSIQISPEYVEYTELYNNKKVLSRKMDICNVKAVNFDFREQIGGYPIHILDKKHVEATNRARVEKASLSAIFEGAITSYTSLQINIEALDVVDKVHLERALELIIRQQGGVDVR